MAGLHLEPVRPGVARAADSRDAGGEALLAAGSLLTRGAAAVAEPPPRADTARLQAQHEVAEAFRFVGMEHPALRELYRLCVERRADSLRDPAR